MVNVMVVFLRCYVSMRNPREPCHVCWPHLHSTELPAGLGGHRTDAQSHPHHIPPPLLFICKIRICSLTLVCTQRYFYALCLKEDHPGLPKEIERRNRPQCMRARRGPVPRTVPLHRISGPLSFVFPVTAAHAH